MARSAKMPRPEHWTGGSGLEDFGIPGLAPPRPAPPPLPVPRLPFCRIDRIERGLGLGLGRRGRPVVAEEAREGRRKRGVGATGANDGDDEEAEAAAAGDRGLPRPRRGGGPEGGADGRVRRRRSKRPGAG